MSDEHRRHQLASVAEALHSAVGTGGAVALPSSTVDGLTWDEARFIARSVDRLRIETGDSLIGYKLGWTSAAMREALGIDQPNWGTLWASQWAGWPADGPADLVELRHPKIEPELVYRTGETLAGPTVDEADVLAAADGWALGLEVVHPRFPSFDFTWLDNTADNSSAQAVAVGPWGSVDDPAAVEVVFAAEPESPSDGRVEVRRGSGRAAMDSPAEAVAWLVDQLHAEGQVLEAGMIVFTGGLTAPYDLTAGFTYRLESESLSPLVLTVR